MLVAGREMYIQGRDILSAALDILWGRCLKCIKYNEFSFFLGQ